MKPKSVLFGSDFSTDAATKAFRELMPHADFQNPKPVPYIKQLTAYATDLEDTVLDFFSGSCTAAHAVLEQNRKDGGSRRFIMVQLPEPLPSPEAELRTIADIGKERIRRVIARMNDEDAAKLDIEERDTPEDLGFRVFKLAPSNLRPWPTIAPEDEAAVLEHLQQQLEPLLEGWTEAGLIAEIALKEGFGLNYRLEQLDEANANGVYTLRDPDKQQTLYVCLDERLKDETWEALNLGSEDLFVCRDSALTDTQAANLALQCRLHTI